jgi:hypothetical protein
MQYKVAEQVALKLKTSRRYGIARLVMSPREFVQLPLERPACGNQIHWFDACSGS